MYEEFAQTLYTAYLEKNEKDFSEFFENFLSSLNEKGMMKLLPKILREIEALEEKSKGDNKTIIIVKDKSVLDDLKVELQKYAESFNLENMDVKEDETIVGGYILKNKTKMIDKSFKKSLINLYQKLIK